MPIMHRVTVELTHRPERDGTVWESSHATFFLIVETAMQAWISALDQAGTAALSAWRFAVANLNVDYRRQMHTEAATFDVTFERIGNSSITLSILVTQREELTATISVVLVRVGGLRAESADFSADERKILERLQSGDA
jgi:acyl-CoA thioesterase FadM